MNLFKFIKTLFSNHLIRKTYNAVKHCGETNQMQINNLFAFDGIELR